MPAIMLPAGGIALMKASRSQGQQDDCELRGMTDPEAIRLEWDANSPNPKCCQTPPTPGEFHLPEQATYGSHFIRRPAKV